MSLPFDFEALHAEYHLNQARELLVVEQLELTPEPPAPATPNIMHKRQLTHKE